MSNEKLYSADEICKELNITIYTLSNWYRWQTKQIKNQNVKEPYLPEPIRVMNVKGRPRRWNKDMLAQLKEFKKNLVVGRNGVYGMYSNPLYKETKKYKKSIENVDTE